MSFYLSTASVADKQSHSRLAAAGPLRTKCAREELTSQLVYPVAMYSALIQLHWLSGLIEACLPYFLLWNLYDSSGISSGISDQPSVSCTGISCSGKTAILLLVHFR